MSFAFYQVIMTLELSSFYSRIIWQSIVFKYLALEYLKSFITVSPKERKIKKIAFYQDNWKNSLKAIILNNNPCRI